MTFEPKTAAGRDMLNDLEVLWGKQAWASFPWASTILAIEAEARQQDTSALRGSEVRRVITNAYYDCRNEGETMETAANRAADAVMALAALPPSAPPADIPPNEESDGTAFDHD